MLNEFVAPQTTSGSESPAASKVYLEVFSLQAELSPRARLALLAGQLSRTPGCPESRQVSKAEL
jgi:hypothetical protein